MQDRNSNMLVEAFPGSDWGVCVTAFSFSHKRSSLRVYPSFFKSLKVVVENRQSSKLACRTGRLPSGVAIGFGAGGVEIKLDRQGSISASI